MADKQEPRHPEGPRLKMLRRLTPASQTELGKAMGYKDSGTSSSSNISRVENGLRRPKHDRLDRGVQFLASHPPLSRNVDALRTFVVEGRGFEECIDPTRVGSATAPPTKGRCLHLVPSSTSLVSARSIAA